MTDEMHPKPTPTVSLSEGQKFEDESPLRSAIYAALRSYQMSNMVDRDVGGNYPLVDLCSIDGMGIDTGEEELFMLADHIVSHPKFLAVLAHREPVGDETEAAFGYTAALIRGDRQDLWTGGDRAAVALAKHISDLDGRGECSTAPADSDLEKALWYAEEAEAMLAPGTQGSSGTRTVITLARAYRAQSSALAASQAERAALAETHTEMREALAEWDRYQPDITKERMVRQANAMADAIRAALTQPAPDAGRDGA